MKNVSKFILISIGIFCLQLGFSQTQMHDICPLKVGEELPKASLLDDNGEEIELVNLISDKPTILIFYRGAWCGYCTKHLSELNDMKADVESSGFQMFGITVDQSSKLDESLPKSENEIKVYSDSKLEAIKGFGLDWKVDDELFEKYITKYNLDLEEWSGKNHHTLPVPAIFIIQKNIIQFQYVNPNYSVRLKPETLMAIIKSL
jgi:peroxiredoxin